MSTPTISRPVLADEDFLLVLSRRIYYVGFLFMPLLVLRPGGGFTLSDLLFLLSFGVGLPGIIAKRIPPHFGLQLAVAATGFAVLVSLPVSQDKVSSVLNGLKLVFVWSVWIWQGRAMIDTQARFLRVIECFCIGAVVSSVAGLLEVLHVLSIPGVFVADGRAAGLAQQPNDQGAMLAAALVLAAGGAILLGRRLLTVLAAFIVIGLILSGSVSGMGGALAGLVVVVARTGMIRRYGSRLLTAVALAAVAALVLVTNVSGFANPLERISSTTGVGPNNTVDVRLQTLTDSWPALRQHFSTGVGLDELSSTVSGYYQPHNVLVLALLEGGLPLLLAVLVVSLPVARRLFVRPENFEVGISLGVFVSMALYSMTAPVSYQRYAWLGVLLTYVAVDLPRTSGPPPTARSD